MNDTEFFSDICFSENTCTVGLQLYLLVGPTQLYNTLGFGCYQQSLCVYREGGGEAGMSEDIFIKQKHNRDILFSPFTRPHWIQLRQDGLKGGQSKTILRLCAYNRI